MPIQYSNNWEVKWYGEKRKFPLITISYLDGIIQIYYGTYLHALASECEQCGEIDERAEIRVQHTAYADDYKNYACLCPDCQEEADQYWNERWDDYNSMIYEGLY